MDNKQKQIEQLQKQIEQLQKQIEEFQREIDELEQQPDAPRFKYVRIEKRANGKYKIRAKRFLGERVLMQCDNLGEAYEYCFRFDEFAEAAIGYAQTAS